MTATVIRKAFVFVCVAALILVVAISCGKSKKQSSNLPPAPTPVVNGVVSFGKSMDVPIDNVRVRSSEVITEGNRESTLTKLVDNWSFAITFDGQVFPISLSKSGIFDFDLKNQPEWDRFLRQSVVAPGNSVLSLDWRTGDKDVGSSMQVVDKDGTPVFDTLAMLAPMALILAPHVHETAQAPTLYASNDPASIAFEIDTHTEITKEALRLIKKEQYAELFGTVAKPCAAGKSALIECIMKGAKEEDDGLRWLQHFGLEQGMVWTQGMNLSVIEATSPGIPRDIRNDLIQRAVNDTLREFLIPAGDHTILPSAKQWARSQKTYDGTQPATWAGAIEAYGLYDDKALAYDRFGHVLHLMEDMGQPDHVNRVAHPGSTKRMGDFRKILGEQSGGKCTVFPPGTNDNFVGFEIYWNNLTKQGEVKKIASAIKETPRVFDEMDLYMDSLAGQSTAIQKKYGLPLSGEKSMGVKGTKLITLCNSTIVPNWAAGIAKSTDVGPNGITLPLTEMANLLPNIDPNPATQSSNPYYKAGVEVIEKTIVHSAGLMKLFYDIVNPPPIAYKVEVVQGSSVYEGHWEDVKEKDGKLIKRELKHSANDAVCLNVPIAITITFGPEINPGATHLMDGSSISVKANGVAPKEFTFTQNSGVDKNGPAIWFGVFDSPKQGSELKLEILAFDGRVHYGDASVYETLLRGEQSNPGSKLDGDPSTRAYVGTDKKPYPWTGYEPGPDTSHKIALKQCAPAAEKPLGSFVYLENDGHELFGKIQLSMALRAGGEFDGFSGKEHAGTVRVTTFNSGETSTNADDANCAFGSEARFDFVGNVTGWDPEKKLATVENVTWRYSGVYHYYPKSSGVTCNRKDLPFGGRATGPSKFVFDLNQKEVTADFVGVRPPVKLKVIRR